MSTRCRRVPHISNAVWRCGQGDPKQSFYYIIKSSARLLPCSLQLLWPCMRLPPLILNCEQIITLNGILIYIAFGSEHAGQKLSPTSPKCWLLKSKTTNTPFVSKPRHCCPNLAFNQPLNLGTALDTTLTVSPISLWKLELDNHGCRGS